MVYGLHAYFLLPRHEYYHNALRSLLASHDQVFKMSTKEGREVLWSLYPEVEEQVSVKEEQVSVKEEQVSVKEEEPLHAHSEGVEKKDAIPVEDDEDDEDEEQDNVNNVEHELLSQRPPSPGPGGEML